MTRARRFAKKALVMAPLFLPLRGRALEYVPLYNFSLVGGQYFFAGEKSSMNGNFTANAAPVVRFSERWSVLPIYAGQFRGTKSVTDSVGSGSIFQQMMSHRVSAAGLYTAEGSAWKLKPSVNYKYEFLKETRDENWGKGLFDYQKIGVGFEAENVYKEPFSYRFGYDFYYIQFPNFVSLESKSGVDPNGNPLGRETAGTNVLDTFNHQFTMAASRPFPYNDPKVALTAAYSLLWQTFPDQPIINRQGQPNTHAPRNRQDLTNSLSLSAAHPRTVGGGKYRLNTAFNVGVNYNGSNQNTFDAGQTRFIFDTYSYTSYSAGPSTSLSWGDPKAPTSAGLGLTYSKTQYSGRLAQDSKGVYLSDNQETDRFLLGLNYSYPIAPRFRLMAQANFLWQSSNMKLEKTYKYNYSTANYLFGVTFDY